MQFGSARILLSANALENKSFVQSRIFVISAFEALLASAIWGHHVDSFSYPLRRRKKKNMNLNKYFVTFELV